MDPYLRNKDWLYGLGREGCAVAVWHALGWLGCAGRKAGAVEPGSAQLIDWRGFA
jgi:hypothetical protein